MTHLMGHQEGVEETDDAVHVLVSPFRGCATTNPNRVVA